MKKIKINLPALAFRDASLDFGQSLQAVKLSCKEAMTFKGEFTSFEQMLAHYGGDKNKLQIGEVYKGYIAVYYGSCKQNIVYLDGMLRKMHYRCILSVGQNRHYMVLKPCFNGLRSGSFKQVWNFQTCDFGKLAADLQQSNQLVDDFNPQQLDASLKQKIANSICGILNKPAVLTDDEYFVLRTYLGKEYLKKFVMEM